MQTNNYISRYGLHASRRGFTLLELLVVIGIIAVLVGLGAASYTTAQKKARDAKRRADLKAVQNCMEQNYTTNSYAYQDLAEGTLSGSVNCGSAPAMTAPTDPLSATSYTVTGSTTTTYTITATLEGGGTFQVTNQQ